MGKVRRLAEGLQMPNHSPGCVEGAQWCFRQYIQSKKHDRTMRASFLNIQYVLAALRTAPGASS